MRYALEVRFIFLEIFVLYDNYFVFVNYILKLFSIVILFSELLNSVVFLHGTDPLESKVSCKLWMVHSAHGYLFRVEGTT